MIKKKINISDIQENNEEYKNLKRKFLYKKIFEKNYNYKEFINYLKNDKINGENINNWEISELINKVKEFKKERKNKNFDYKKNEKISLSKLALDENIYLKIKNAYNIENNKTYKFIILPNNNIVYKTKDQIKYLIKEIKSYIPLLLIPKLEKNCWNSKYLNKFFNYIIENKKIRNSKLLEEFLLKNLENVNKSDIEVINYKNNKKLKNLIFDKNWMNLNNEDYIIYKSFCEENYINENLFLNNFIKNNGFINCKNEYKKKFNLMKKINLLSKEISYDYININKKLSKLNNLLSNLNTNKFSNTLIKNEKNFNNKLWDIKNILNNYQLNIINQNNIIEKNLINSSYFFKKCLKDFKDIFNFQDYISEKCEDYKNNNKRLLPYKELKNKIDVRIFNEIYYFNNYYLDSMSRVLNQFNEGLIKLNNIKL